METNETNEDDETKTTNHERFFLGMVGAFLSDFECAFKRSVF